MNKTYLFFAIATVFVSISSCSTMELGNDMTTLMEIVPKSESATVVEHEIEEASPSDFESAVDIQTEVETVEEVIEDVVEDIAEVPLFEEVKVIEDTDVEPEKETVEIVSQSERLRSAKVGSAELPDWFVYISAALILASLFTVAYISKQRKESTWYKRGPRD